MRCLAGLLLSAALLPGATAQRLYPHPSVRPTWADATFHRVVRDQVSAFRPALDYDPTPLTSGVPTPFTLPPASEVTLFAGNYGFRIDVPDQATELEVHLVASVQGVGLALCFNNDFAASNGVIEIDHYSSGTTGNETVTVTPDSTPPLRAGTYYIGFGIFTVGVAISGTITASVYVGPPPVGTLLRSNVPVLVDLPENLKPTLLAGTGGYRVEVPEGAASLEIQLSIISTYSDVDLFVRYGLAVALSNGDVIADYYAASPSGLGTSSIVITPTSSPPLRGGTYYIGFGLRYSATGANVVIDAVVNGGPGAPSIDRNGVVSAALSNPPQMYISANALVTIFGQNLAPAGTAKAVSASDLLPDGSLPIELLGVCVVFNNARARLLFASPQQLNVQVPSLTDYGYYIYVQVITNCDTALSQTSPVERVLLATVTPDLFTFVQHPSGGSPVASVFAGTDRLVGDPSLASHFPGAGLVFTPAKPGDLVSLFATGLGPTSPPYEAGVIPRAAAATVNRVQVMLGEQTLSDSDVLYAGVAPGFAGLYQIDIRIPDSVYSGDQAIRIAVSDVFSQGYAILTIKR